MKQQVQLILDYIYYLILLAYLHLYLPHNIVIYLSDIYYISYLLISIYNMVYNLYYYYLLSEVGIVIIGYIEILDYLCLWIGLFRLGRRLLCLLSILRCLILAFFYPLLLALRYCFSCLPDIHGIVHYMQILVQV